jgi:hypothetical protein
MENKIYRAGSQNSTKTKGKISTQFMQVLGKINTQLCRF